MSGSCMQGLSDAIRGRGWLSMLRVVRCRRAMRTARECAAGESWMVGGGGMISLRCADGHQ
eukprot:3667644-Rhodomonas_salina.2